MDPEPAAHYVPASWSVRSSPIVDDVHDQGRHLLPTGPSFHGTKALVGTRTLVTVVGAD